MTHDDQPPGPSRPGHAGAVHELNHRTRDQHAFTRPAELYRLVGELGLMSAGLPQLLGQLARWLHTQQAAGRVRTDDHTDPGAVVDQATGHLTEAGAAAHDLVCLLARAQQHLSHLGAAPPPPATGVRSRREQDLADITAGLETVWWDDNGRPAPWPDDFFDEDSDWSTASIDSPPLPLAPGEPPSDHTPKGPPMDPPRP